MLRSLKNLKPKDATIAVRKRLPLGRSRKIRKVMDESKIIELENDVYTLKRGNGMLHIAGVDSITLEKHD